MVTHGRTPDRCVDEGCRATISSVAACVARLLFPGAVLLRRPDVADDCALRARRR